MKWCKKISKVCAMHHMCGFCACWYGIQILTETYVHYFWQAWNEKILKLRVWFMTILRSFGPVCTPQYCSFKFRPVSEVILNTWHTQTVLVSFIKCFFVSVMMCVSYLGKHFSTLPNYKWVHCFFVWCTETWLVQWSIVIFKTCLISTVKFCGKGPTEF